MTTGARIRGRRQQLKITQDDLAARCSISQTQISEYERGNASLRADVAVAIARELGVTVEWLITGQGEPPVEHPGADAA